MKGFDLSKIGPAVRSLNAGLFAAPPPQNRVVVVSPGHAPAVTAIMAGQIEPPPSKKTRGKRQPTKTEAAAIEYLKRLPDVVDVRFNPMSLHLANGHRYTPDASFIRSGVLHLVEVKGSYRLGSLQRSRLAYDQARIEWPMFTFWWMERQKDGSWRFME